MQLFFFFFFNCPQSLKKRVWGSEQLVPTFAAGKGVSSLVHPTSLRRRKASSSSKCNLHSIQRKLYFVGGSLITPQSLLESNLFLNQSSFCLRWGTLWEEGVCVGPVIDVKQLVTVVICGTISVPSYKYMSSVFLVVVIVYLFVLDWIQHWLA